MLRGLGYPSEEVNCILAEKRRDTAIDMSLWYI